MNNFTPDADSDLDRAFVEFFEQFPLLRKKRFDPPLSDSALPKPAIHLPCERCRRDQTFVFRDEYRHRHQRRPTFGPAGPGYFDGFHGDVVEASFICAGCAESPRYFLLQVAADGGWIQKLGQYPPWDIALNRELERTLGEHANLYRRGLVCESQGYGIGAFAYYRRIVEHITDELLESVVDLLESSQQTAYRAALERTRGSRTASEKFDVVKEMLPAVLRPGGMDPLGGLYGHLSDGIHEIDDEQCLEAAAEIRACLEYVIEQIVRHKHATKGLADRMAALLDKKQKRTARREG